jgi:Mn-containing catalase
MSKLDVKFREDVKQEICAMFERGNMHENRKERALKLIDKNEERCFVHSSGMTVHAAACLAVELAAPYCCENEDRDMNGGCRSCGDPCL